MKISTRETVLGIAALAALLFGFTYWLAGTRIESQRQLGEEKARLLRQIELHKRILAEQTNWVSRLEELQAQLPVYDPKVSVTAELLKEIKRTADEYGLDLVRTQPYREEQVATLYELGVSCSWEGELEALVRFLFKLQAQGIRYDVRQLSAQPDAQREGRLKGSMIIDCAYRRGETPPASSPQPAGTPPENPPLPAAE
jgi:Tfp pilus assembly protein PilO